MPSNTMCLTMSELYNSELFDQLSSIDIDPYITRVAQQAAELELFMNDDSVEDDDEGELASITRQEIISERLAQMDKECPYMYKNVLVTGKLTQAYYNEFTSEYDRETVEYDNSALRSFGYTVLGVTDEASGESKNIVGHSFLIENLAAVDSGSALVDYVPRIFAFAPVREVEIRYDQDNDINLQKLEASIPELRDDVDNLLGIADSECDALINLGHMMITRTMDIPKDVRDELLSYVYKRLNFDTAVPYEVVVHGIVYNNDDRTETGPTLGYFRDKPGLMVAYPTSLSLMPYPKVVDKQLQMSDDAYWCVNIDVMGLRVGDENRHLTVPVRNIRSMKSLRTVINGL